jgi:hypothetical protein
MWSAWSPARLTTDSKLPRVAALAILAIFAIATLYVTVHHEPWRDEADSWLVVRDASIVELFHWTRNVGTPALWQLLLKPLVVLGLPFEAQGILHVALAWAAAAVLLFRSPFTRLTQILLLGSYYLAYEYAVIARSYVLTVLILWVIAAWYPTRHERPVRYGAAVALLFNTNVHGGLIAAIVAALFLFDRRRSWSGLLIMAAGGFAAAWQLRPAPDAPFPHVVRNIRPDTVSTAIGSGFFPAVSPGLAFAAGLLILILLGASMRRRRDALLLLVLTTVALSILYVFVWFGGYRHAGLMFLSAVFAIWIARELPSDALTAVAAVMFHVALVTSVIFTVRMAAADIKFDFSGAREMGAFITANGLDRYDIAAHDLQPAEAVLPYVPGKKLWYSAMNRYGTYMRWNREEEIGHNTPYDIAVARAVQHFAPSRKPWLLLLNIPLPDPEARGFRLVYRTRGFVYRHRDERFWLYQWVGSTR